MFHTQFDPGEFQKIAKHADRNDLGFWWVSDFGKFHLEWFPDGYEFNDPGTLYVGIPEEFPETIQPLTIIKHPLTNQELFWITDGKKDNNL